MIRSKEWKPKSDTWHFWSAVTLTPYIEYNHTKQGCPSKVVAITHVFVWSISSLSINSSGQMAHQSEKLV